MVLAKHLPVMKHMNRTSDPYVEVVLLNIIASPSTTGMDPLSEDQLSHFLRHLVDCEYDILSSGCNLKYDYNNVPELLQQFHISMVQVLGYHRTSVKVKHPILLMRLYLMFPWISFRINHAIQNGVKHCHIRYQYLVNRGNLMHLYNNWSFGC
jgi:hypothetical protein